MVYMIWKSYVDSQPATQEQLLILSRETPCVQEAFRQALKPDDGSRSEPLTLGEAKQMAKKCRDTEALSENEKQEILGEQLKALNDIRQR